MSKHEQGRKAQILIVHGLVWAAVIFGASWLFRDKAGGEYLWIWTVVGFAVSNVFVLRLAGRSGSGD